MKTKETIEQATTRIAKRLAREAGQPESLWQLFLMAAYEEYHGITIQGRSDV